MWTRFHFHYLFPYLKSHSFTKFEEIPLQCYHILGLSFILLCAALLELYLNCLSHWSPLSEERKSHWLTYCHDVKYIEPLSKTVFIVGHCYSLGQKCPPKTNMLKAWSLIQKYWESHGTFKWWGLVRSLQVIDGMTSEGIGDIPSSFFLFLLPSHAWKSSVPHCAASQ
jgi:hypothetical protein